MASLLTPEVLKAVGRTETFTAPEALGEAAIRYFALAIDDRNGLYLDSEYAAESRYRGIVAPPTFICETLQYMAGPPNEDGYIGFDWRLPFPPHRMIRGGNDYEFFEAARPSDVLTVTWTLTEVYERETRRGLMLFAISEIEYRNQHGTLLARNRETIVYEPLQVPDDRGEAS